MKERFKLTKYFYKNGQRENGSEKVLEKAVEYIKEILEAKEPYIFKMKNKLEDDNVATKKYWTMLNHLLSNKMIPGIKF